MIGIVVVMFFNLVIFCNVFIFFVRLNVLVLIKVGEIVFIVIVLLLSLLVFIVKVVGMVLLCRVRMLLILVIIILLFFRFVRVVGKLVINVVFVNLVILNSIFCICEL